MPIGHRSQKGPFHFEFLNRPEDEYRRHRNRCIYFDKNDEYCSIKEKMCYGACNCCYYKEKSDYVRRRNSKKELYNQLFPSQYDDNTILDVLELECSKSHCNTNKANEKEDKSINKDDYKGILPTYIEKHVKKSYLTHIYTYKTESGEQILFCRRQEDNKPIYKKRDISVFSLPFTKKGTNLAKKEPVEFHGKTFFYVKEEIASVSSYEPRIKLNKINNKKNNNNKNNIKNTKKR